jgi:hypothetical protein
MVGQMLHLRAAAIADACGRFLWIGCGFEHRRSEIEKPKQINGGKAESLLYNLRHFRRIITASGGLSCRALGNTAKGAWSRVRK